MPVVPQPNAQGVVRSLGFAFNFSNAFATTAQAQGIPVNTSFATLQASLGANTDIYPTQQTAWGRANQGAIGFSTLTTPSGVGQVGTVNDVRAPNTSLWALTKEASFDAITAGQNANVALQSANIAITTADGAMEVANSVDTLFTTLTTPDAVGQVGTVNDAPSAITSLWAYAKLGYEDAQTATTNANLAFSLATTATETANTAQNTANKALNYNLTGATMNSQITNRAVALDFPQAVFTLATSITYNVPPNWTSTDSVYFDGWVLYNFEGSANVNSYWGANYTTNQELAPTTDILGSTSVVANAIHFSVDNQVYLPFNLVIPPTYLVAGGTINISFFAYITTTDKAFSVEPVVAGRVGLALE